VGTLTKKQNDFILHYVQTRNIFQSAIEAGYSLSYAKSKSHELLKNPLIQEKVTYLTDEYFKNKFQALALDSIKELSVVLGDSENRATQFKAIQYILSQAKITDQEDNREVFIEAIIPPEYAIYGIE